MTLAADLERALTVNATAVITVDGEEFVRLYDAKDHDEMFDETVKREGGEVALLVYKPRYQGWLRERLSITASR